MSSESRAYYGGHDDEETMSYTEHDATSIEDMGNGSYTDDEAHDMIEHYTDPGSTSFHDMMERYTDPDSMSINNMSDYFDYSFDNMQEEMDDGATVHKVYYTK